MALERARSMVFDGKRFRRGPDVVLCSVAMHIRKIVDKFYAKKGFEPKVIVAPERMRQAFDDEMFKITRFPPDGPALIAGYWFGPTQLFFSKACRTVVVY